MGNPSPDVPQETADILLCLVFSLEDLWELQTIILHSDWYGWRFNTAHLTLVVDQCLNSVHGQLTDFAKRVEDKSVLSSLPGASLHPLLMCLDKLSTFTGHVYIGELLAEIPKLTTSKLLLEKNTL